MADWDNTPVKQRQDAIEVKVTDTPQDALVGAADSAYYADVYSNAPELGVPSIPASLVITNNTGGQGTITWTDAGYAADSYLVYYISGTVVDPGLVVTNGRYVPNGNPAGTVIKPGAGTWTVVVAGVNEFGSGPFALKTGTIT